MTSPPVQNSNTRPETSRTIGAVASEGGFQFEIKMAALIGLRGLNRSHDFELSSNTQEVDKFDDIVYKAGDRRYFLQLKHSDVGKCLYVDDLKEEKKNILTGCFKSYCKIANDFKEEEKEFIIYTNRGLAEDLSKHKKKIGTKVDIFFKTCEGEVFTFTRDTNKDRDVYTFLENKVKKSEKNMVSRFLNKLIMVTGQKGHRDIDALIINELKVGDKFHENTVKYKSILHHFKTLIENWWRKHEREPMTPKLLNKWLQRAKTEYFTPSIDCFYQTYKKQFPKTNTRCFGEEVTKLNTKLSDNSAVHLKSDGLKLCSILLMECVPKSKGIFVTYDLLQSNKNMLLHAWLEGMWEYLIVFCDSTVQDSDISDTCHDILKFATSSKRVIIVTARLDLQINNFVPIEQEFNFMQLAKKLQEKLLDKKIDFQGFEVTMKSVLKKHNTVKHVWGPEFVADMITEDPSVNIGGCLQQKPKRYITRVLKKKTWFSLNTLKELNTSALFAVSGMEKKDLVDIVGSEKVGEFQSEEDSGIENSTQNNDMSKKRFIVLLGKDLKCSFSKLCKNNSTKPLNWLKYKDDKLLLKRRSVNNQKLLDCVDAEKSGTDEQVLQRCMKNESFVVNEEDVWKLGERTVLVVAEPGMGKSSTTTQVAWNTKLADPASWVVRINWNDQTKKLKGIEPKNFNVDSLVEFLSSAAFPESKYMDTNRRLLKQALQIKGNVTVLMDGFDEISPTHADKAAVILSELMKTKVRRVWVTSRPVQKERLEKELSVIAFSMKKLSRESQEEMFWDIWKDSANIKKRVFLNKYIKPILSQANNSDQQRNFTGCPLYFTITVSCYKECLQKSLNGIKVSLPQNLNFLLLCDTLVTRKFDTYETDKKRQDSTNASVQDDIENLKKMTMENLEKCSLLVTMPSLLNRLSDLNIESTIQPFVKRVEKGNDKVGIVMKVVGDRPHFVHRTIADYFTAHWCSKNFLLNREVLKDVLFESSYGIVRNLFDRILAKNRPLHCAVLNWDIENVENELKSGSDVNYVDSGGRTAMHLIAAHGPNNDNLCREITNALLKKGVTADTKDKVFEWKPLQYAKRTDNRIVIELLSGSSVRQQN